MVPQLTPVELKHELDSGRELLLLDVREPEEIAVSALPGIMAIPMGELADRLADIPMDQEIVVICRSGNRSGRVTEFLMGQGYSHIRNLAGGMTAWAATVQPGLPVG